MNAANDSRPLILITGSSGLIGSRIRKELQRDCRVVGLDLEPPSTTEDKHDWFCCDLTADQSVRGSLQRVREKHGEALASVIHLAAYYNFTGEPSDLYETLTVEGTRRLLQSLQIFDVQQFVFSSTLLAMKSADDGLPIDADSQVKAEWAYPKSKLAAEQVIHNERGDTHSVVLRIAGVYDEQGHSLPIAQQIGRIYEKQLESYFFPGDKSHGQSFIHLDDLAKCFRAVVEHRSNLGDKETFVIGEEDVMSYEELQDQIGELIHGREWPALRIPKFAAKAGAWVKDKLASNEQQQFIKPWMIDLADQNYPVTLQRARRALNWEPKHTLRETLPAIIAFLKQSPEEWHETNGLPVPDKAKESAAETH